MSINFIILSHLNQFLIVFLFITNNCESLHIGDGKTNSSEISLPTLSESENNSSLAKSNTSFSEEYPPISEEYSSISKDNYWIDKNDTLMNELEGSADIEDVYSTIDEIKEYFSRKISEPTTSYYVSHGLQRRKRYSHYRQRPGDARRRRRRIATSSIGSPSGKTYNITMPAYGLRNWKCGDPTTLITLNPNGTMGKEEYNLVSQEMQGQSHGLRFQISKIEKVVNPCIWQKYSNYRRTVIAEAGTANDRLLFHGSPQFQSLVDKGFDERYASQYGKFGAGVYFASHSSKSYYFSGGTGKMLLCRVTLGRTMQYSSNQRLQFAPPGYNSVEGILHEPEYIVYRGEQAYPEYLISFSKLP